MNLLFVVMGYTASLIIFVSMLMTNVYRLRQINLAGALLFALYGYWFKAWPVVLMNLLIAGVDIWILLQMMRYSAYFDLAPATSIGKEYLHRFFLFHERELRKHSPGLTFEDLVNTQACILFRNMLPVGLFAYRQEGQDAEIVLDFMIADYRDYKAGRFLYKTKRMYFKEQGIKRFRAVARHPSHPKYFLRNGFVREDGKSGAFVNEL
ncbi:MAG: hypothetical protein GX803_07130 [Lentisphaerae bacterium]|nr:hypothetical protein [Lentisphaerota bacterium]